MQTVLEFFNRPVRGEMAPGVPMPNVCGWLNVFGQFVIQPLDTVQDVGITLFLLRLHALAEKLLAFGIQGDAFNLGAAEVYANAKHGSNL